MRRYAIGIISCALGLLFTGCGQQDDPHMIPRESKAYESVDAASLDRAALVTHLNTLVSEIEAATEANATGEFHHLETALTPALEAAEKMLPDKSEALATIATLKTLAIQLHEAGHDANANMGLKLSAKISELVAKVTNELQ